MIELPKKIDLSINLLAACFKNTVATYKFYWLLSILHYVENGRSSIPKKDLFARMISEAWYTVNYFHVSFGKQDLIQESVLKLKEIENISIDEKVNKIIHHLISSNNAESHKILWHFNKQVPHWFLSPWFPTMKNEKDFEKEKRIYEYSKKFFNNCIYALYEDKIEINPAWQSYLIDNSKLLKDYCLWNLTLFLQSKNPSIPDIPGKLIKPAIRNNLIKQRTDFWDVVLKEISSIKCIYTNKNLTIGNYAVEHFIPYSFVSHDLIWNLIPADKSFNCSKSDKLPNLDIYFDKFYNIQTTALRIIQEKAPKNKFLDEYLGISPNLSELSKEKYRDHIQPLIKIASNNGFEFLP